jgi:hypothetical protein
MSQWGVRMGDQVMFEVVTEPNAVHLIVKRGVPQVAVDRFVIPHDQAHELGMALADASIEVQDRQIAAAETEGL